MNKKTKILAEKLYDLSAHLRSFCHGVDEIPKEVLGKRILTCRGHLYNSKKLYDKAVSVLNTQGESDEDEEVTFWDFRDRKHIDPEIPKYAFQLICHYIEESYHAFSNDEFSILVGAAVNLYYVTGLHTCLGAFDSNAITDSIIVESRLKEYIKYLCRYIHVRAVLFSKECQGEVMEDAQITLRKGEKLSVIMKDNEQYAAFLPEIRFYERYIDDALVSLDKLQNELMIREPDYRIGNIYECIESVRQDYSDQNRKRNFSKYAGILGVDLYNHVVGKPKLFDVTFVIENGKLKIDTDFEEEFGLGIPYVELRDSIMCSTETGEFMAVPEELQEELLEEIDENIENEPCFADFVEEEKNYIYTYDDVRSLMSEYLGMGMKVQRPITAEYIRGANHLYVGEYDDLSFQDYFRKIVYESNRTEREIAKTVGLNETTTNAIINGKTREPSTVMLLTFAISLRLSFDDTQTLLRKAGRCISERLDVNGRKERMLADYIYNRIYDITRINIELDASGLPILGAKDR